jgi:hypothetical protein
MSKFRRNQTRPRPSRGDFEARLSAVQRQSEQGNDHSNQDYNECETSELSRLGSIGLY